MGKNKNRNRFNKNQKKENDGVVSVGVELSGFPVLVGTEKFFFSTAEDNVERFLEFQKNPEKYVAKVQALADSTDLTDKEFKSAEDLPTVDEYREYIGAQKEALKIMYDIMLGEGSFDRLYATYRDSSALAKIMGTVIETIGLGLDKYAATQRVEQKKLAAQRVNAKKEKRV